MGRKPTSHRVEIVLYQDHHEGNRRCQHFYPSNPNSTEPRTEPSASGVSMCGLAAPLFGATPFLRSQPSIEELVDVDVFASRLPSPDPTFLPNLKSLACDFVDTAIYLMPGRRVQSVSIKIAVHAANLPEFERASCQTLRPITEVDMGIAPLSRENMAVIPQVLTRCFPLVKRLRLASLPLTVLNSLAKAHFPHLESLECPNLYLVSTSEIGDWAWAISPLLRSMRLLGPDIEWVRSDLDAKE